MRADAKSSKKFRNVSIDSDILNKLHVVSDHLEALLGFRPTLSQTIRHLINEAQENAERK